MNKQFLMIIISLIILSFVSAQKQTDDYYFDLGIVIEKPGKDISSSRVVTPVSKEIELRIKKIESGYDFTTTPREVLTVLTRIKEQMTRMEDSFRNEIAVLKSENRNLQIMIAGLSIPHNQTPVEPEIHLPTAEPEPYLADMDISDPPLCDNFELNFENYPERVFDRALYMSAVFAYQKENYYLALNLFQRLDLDMASQATAGNVLYWIADSYNHTGEYHQAMETLNRLLSNRDYERIDDALVQKAILFRKIGEEDSALVAFRDVINTCPESEYVKLAALEIKKADARP